MIHNQQISVLEIMEEYPCSATFIGIEELTLECINKELEQFEGFKLKTLDADYVHVYKNYIIILVRLHEEDEITMYAFSEKEKVSEEELEERRKTFFDILNKIY